MQYIPQLSAYDCSDSDCGCDIVTVTDDNIVSCRIGRHSKSLDTARKVCGYCRSPFQLMVNTPRGPMAAKTPTGKTPNKFAQFVQGNYGRVKSRGGMSHKDVMNALSADFAAMNKI